MGKTFAEKILSDRAGREATAGELVTVAPDYVVLHDDSVAISEAVARTGSERVWDPRRVVVVLDHCVPAASEELARRHREVRAFIASQGIVHLFDAGRGVCHQVLPEEGFALPGRLILGSSAYTTTYGAMGTFAAGIDGSQAASIWATGEIGLRVPATLRVEVTGSFPAGVGSMDLALKLVGQIGAAGGLHRAMELCGSTVRGISTGGRMTLCNMAAETGATIAYVPPDGVTLRYLSRRSVDGFEPVFSDPDATYERILQIEISELVPLVARPPAVDRVVPVSEVAGTPIDQALLGSCANGRVEDLWSAANLLRGKRVHPGVRLLVSPASSTVYLDAMRLGVLADLVEAGGIVLNPGCGPCSGAHQGILAPGEVCIGTSNDNARGRIGSDKADLYLASPETVAASALSGRISDPRELQPG
jgi:homoaconitate hydratase family protein